MKRVKPIVTRNAVELARALGLSAAHAHRWKLRSDLVSKIISAVEEAGITHAQLAKKVKTSRTRITSILNRRIDDVSTDLMLRVLETLGYRVSISFSRIKLAA